METFQLTCVIFVAWDLSVIFLIRRILRKQKSLKWLVVEMSLMKLKGLFSTLLWKLRHRIQTNHMSRPTILLLKEHPRKEHIALSEVTKSSSGLEMERNLHTLLMLIHMIYNVPK
jgi:hypothetical protein